MYYPFIRKILFQLDPEYAQEFALQQLRRFSGTYLKSLIYHQIPKKPMICMGLNFKNPLGLAAGLDKNGKYIDVLGVMGFGFIEVGTVTPRPQLGNKRPRLFRLLEVEGFINRMGFNNLGVDHLISNIKNSKFDGVLGINISKNKDTPIENEQDDFLICMEKVYAYASYIAINISSPNTPGLRMLQFGDSLDNLLKSVKRKQKNLQKQHNRYVPVTIKIGPDLSEEELIRISDSLVRHSIDGVIATNTTLDRLLITGIEHYNEHGGLSGRPIQLKSTKIISRLYSETKGRIPIIGVGGVESIIAAREKIDAGASLIQIYSGLIFKGPMLIKQIITHI